MPTAPARSHRASKAASTRRRSTPTDTSEPGSLFEPGARLPNLIRRSRTRSEPCRARRQPEVLQSGSLSRIRLGLALTRHPFRDRFPDRSLNLGSTDFDELLRERRQQLDTVVAHDSEVFDAAAARALEVDARLDRHDVAGLERVGRLRGESRRLVDQEADAVAEAVAEVLAETCVRDRVARER